MELHSLLTRNPLEASVHVTNLFAIKQDTLSDYLDQFTGHFDRIIGFRPTGWSFKSGKSSGDAPSVAKTISDLSRSSMPTALYPQRGSTERCQMYSVCYSEHSSFSELVSATPRHHLIAKRVIYLPGIARHVFVFLWTSSVSLRR
jgi:DNA cross-link repair 1A protein